MMIRALATPALTKFGVAVTIVQQYDDEAAPVKVMHLQASGDDGKTVTDTWGGWSDHEPCEQFAPTLLLSDDIARPLLDALTRYYDGAEDTRMMRRDLDAERKRTDVLIDHLGTVARTLAGPAGPNRVTMVRDQL
jgi:hypothetical protein